MQNLPSPRCRVIRLRTCLDIIGLARSTLFDIANPNSPRFDPTFPKKLRIGLRAVGWLEDEIYEWLASKRDPTGPAATDPASPPRCRR